jgi:hypothetical protein
LLDVNIPEGVDNMDQEQGDGNVFSIEVPLHARYGVPKRGGELIDEVMFPPPVAFWACPQEGASGSGGTTITFHLSLIVKLFHNVCSRGLQQNGRKYPMRYMVLSKMIHRRLYGFHVRGQCAHRRCGYLLGMQEMWRLWRLVRLCSF